MIPSDIKITPLSGSGDSSVSMTMEEYTGRVAKPTREVWVYDTEDTVSDMVEVDQYPKTEFIGLNDPLIFPVVALGGEITVTGTSNSSALKPVEFDEALEFELSINGEVQPSWSPDNPIITGDIGADEEYSYSLKITVPENQTTSQKSWTFQLSNNAQIVTATITINQAAGVRTYSDITISEFSYPIAPAAGGTLTPTLSYSQTWGWNGQTTGGGTITSGAVLSYEAIGGWHQSVLDPVTGIITAPSRGTVISNQQYEFDVRVSVSLNGRNASEEYSIQQEENKVVQLEITTYLFTHYPTIPASGGSSSPGLNGAELEFTFTSGSTSTTAPSSIYGTLSSSKTYSVQDGDFFTINSETGEVTASSRGTVVGDTLHGYARVDGTYTWTPSDVYPGEVCSADIQLYGIYAAIRQEANIQTQTGIRIEGDTVGGDGWIPHEYWDNINAAGKASTIPGDDSDAAGYAIRFTGYRQYSYTSGATDEETVTNISHSLGAQKNVDWIGYHTYGYVLNRQGNSNNAYRGTTIGNERTAEVWWEENGFESNHLTVTQAKNVPVSGVITNAEFSYPDNVIPPVGGHSYAESHGAFSITWSSGALSFPSGTQTGFTYTPVGTYTMVATEGFSILDYNGRITATGMGSILGSRSCGKVTRTLYYTVTIDSTYGGGTFNTTTAQYSLTAPVTQGVNERIYDTPVIILGTPADIPASGGTVSSVPILSVVQPFHYTSGTTATDTNPARTNEVWIPVTAESKGTTVSERTLAGQLKYSCICHDVEGTASVNVYQAANRVVSTEWTSASCTVEPSQRVLTYEGGITTFTKSAVKNGTETYTSGITKAVTYSAAVWSSSINYGSGSGWISSVDTLNDRIIVSENPNTTSRTAVITITASLNGMTASDTITVNQDAAHVELEVSPTQLVFPEYGGTLTIQITSSTPWTIDGTQEGQ